MKKSVFILIFCLNLIGVIKIFSQTVISPGNDGLTKRTKILPASPNATSIAKYGGVDVLLNTGSINKSIELKGATDRAISIPILLNYTSNGIKVTEQPSRAGIGWSLEVGGQISRVVKGRDDFLYERYVLPSTTSPNDEDPSVTTYCWKLLNEGMRDAEPDVFTYSFGKYSGKFIFDNTGAVVGLPATNLKITYNPQYSIDNSWFFKVVAPDGITYIFGGVTATESGKMGTSTSGNVFVPNVWHLIKVIHPNGYFTTLSYEQFLTSYVVDKSETQYKLSPDWSSPLIAGGITVDGYISNYSEIQNISAKTCVVNEINTSTGAKVTFSYSATGYPEKIINQIVSTNENGVQLSKYAFEYDYITAGGTTIPFLRKIKELNSAGVALNNGHEFNYYNESNIPERFSNSQDHWGFYNGKTNSTLIPTPDDIYIASLFPNATANRNPDPLYAGNGLLSKITFPTGGQDEIIYEPNIVKEQQDINGYSIVNTNVTSYIDNVTVQSPSVTFTVNYESKVKLEAKSEDINYPTITHPHSPSGQVFIVNNATNETKIIQLTVQPQGGSYEVSSVSLQPGYYTMYVTSKGINIKTTGKITYRLGTAPNMQYVDVVIGGMRVQKVTTNALSGSPMVKRYYYGTMADLNFSSASYVPKPSYFTQYDYTVGVQDNNNCTILYHTYNHAALNYRTLVRENLYDGILVKYNSVIESIGGDNFENGAVEHKFDISADYPSQVIRGNKVEAELSNGSYTEKGETETTTYAQKGGTLVKVLFTQNEVTIDSRLFGDNLFFSVYAGGSIGCTSWNGNLLTGPYPLLHKLYHINKYYLRSWWKYLSKKTEQQFDENGLNPVTVVTNYFYDNDQNILLTRVESLNSKGELFKTTYKYPNDFASSGNVYADMVNKNMVDFVVEEKKYKDGNELEASFNNYSNSWQPGATQVALSSVETQKAGYSKEPRFRYYQYDTYGNPMELSKENDQRQSYVWDYHAQFPVAEAINASQADIAFSSFEADGTGGWVYNGSGTADATSPAGKKVYTLGAGYITKTGLNAATSYIVSYWTKNTVAYNITGTVSGYPIKGRSINGWNYFEHKIYGQSTVTISGTGSIDEVRLYPEKAMMTTVGYEPLVGTQYQSDPNSKMAYYWYDDFNRLAFIRDQDNNILKRFCYNYTGQPENCNLSLPPCIDFSPNWQNTITALRCQQGSCGNTGYQEQEQKDVNPCSSTYNQTQWVLAGYNPTACTPATCVTITCNNVTGDAGYVAVYTSTSPGGPAPVTFSVAATAGVQTLGTLPPGTYNLSIYRSVGMPMYGSFKSGCNKLIITGVSATYANINVSSTTCNSIMVDISASY